MPAMSLTPAVPTSPPLPGGIAIQPADALQAVPGQPAVADFAALLLQQLGLPDGAGNLLAPAADDAAGDDAVLAAALNDLAALLPTLAPFPGAVPADPALADAPADDAAAGDAALLSVFLDAARGLLGQPPAAPADGAAATALPAADGIDAAAGAPAGGLPAIVAAPDKMAGDALPAATLPRELPADLPLAAAADPAQAAPASAARSERPADLPAARVDTPVGSRGWDAEVGQRLVWMVNRNEGRAELTLTPPQMGRIEVTLSTSGDQTNAVFVAASPAAREALENALPRLRELLADAGVTLGQASVNADTPRGDDDPRGGRGGRAMARSGDAAAADAPRWLQRGSGLIDTFA